MSAAHNTKAKRVHFPERFPRKLGVALGSALPVAATQPFHVFNQQGRFAAMMEHLGEVPLDREALEKMQAFHQVVFGDVLKMGEGAFPPNML